MSLISLYSRPVILFLFVFAGYYKAAPLFRLVPVDITLLFAVLTAALCVWTFIKERHVPAGTVVMVGLFVTLLAGLRVPADLADYATQKSLRLFSLTALAAFAPLLLVRDDRDREAFMVSIVALGSLMALFTLFDLVIDGVPKRGSVWNVNPIVLARASGFAALGVLLFFWHGRLRVWQGLPLIAITVAGLVLSGSRGPVVALAAAALLSASILGVNSVSGRRAWFTLLGVGGAGLAAITWLSSSYHFVGRRMLRLLTGDWQSTELTRMRIWSETGSTILENPLGLGWGKFSETVRVFHNNEILAFYPHNIFLEVFVEAGWPAGLFFTCLVCWLLISTFRRTSRRDDLNSHLVTTGLVYWVLCAAFSGDVNDNRPFWAFLSVALFGVLTQGLGHSGGQAKRSRQPDECRRPHL